MKAAYKRLLKNKTILVTGGTGSFGNEVTNALLFCQPKRIIIFSRDEKKQFDMRNKYKNPLLKFVIGDVRDYSSINKAMYGVDYVFHAAALKQVPTCEFFPMEAIKTNVLGTENTITAALNNNVKKVVALSTDKAVYPINVIGLTKALMEKIISAESKENTNKRTKTILCSVRYGNVLYTRGSVVPHFIEYIKTDKKLPVTSTVMTRFLLPLPDAVDLVLYALAKGKPGYLYVRKSPATTIGTLAEALCAIFKHQKGFTEVGIRAGEKMHETLVTQEELIRSIDAGHYYEIPPESQGLDYNQYFVQGKKAMINNQSFTSENTTRLDLDQTIKLLLKLPEIQEELNLSKQR
ncbi:polysaccharide biosynthesis protein [Candidatus Roizmanbacteria bacterium]|nr:polysaccharide biosynthesis protein [Candidatus Roizmanbacteria bacterium]